MTKETNYMEKVIKVFKKQMCDVVIFVVLYSCITEQDLAASLINVISKW